MPFRLLTRDFLNERMVPEVEMGTVQYYDHLRRYLFAQQFVYNRHVLDIACGTGYGSDILLRGGARQVISVDLSAAAVEYAARRWRNRQFVQADAAHLPLPGGAVETIVSFETLEHLPDPERFLSEARRVLAADGYLIISTPNRAIASPHSDTPYSPYHTFEPTRAELIDLLEKSGWKVLELRGMTHSNKAQSVMRPPSGPFQRETAQDIAWAAYFRLGLRALLPPVIYEWLGRRRSIPALDIADSFVLPEATDESSYFIGVCRPAQPAASNVQR